MQCKGWEIRSIYEVPLEDVLKAEPFFRAFGQVHDINGHTLEVIVTRPKSTLITNAFTSREHEGLSQIDRVLILHSSDISGITAGESLRLDGKLYRIASVSTPIRQVVRLDLQGIES